MSKERKPCFPVRKTGFLQVWKDSCLQSCPDGCPRGISLHLNEQKQIKYNRKCISKYTLIDRKCTELYLTFLILSCPSLREKTKKRCPVCPGSSVFQSILWKTKGACMEEIMKYGYAYTSPAEPLVPFCDGRIFLDSPADTSAPAFQELLRCLNSGDEVILPSASCLGMDFSQICIRWKLLLDRQVQVRILDLPSGPESADQMNALIGYLVQTQQGARRRRQAMGAARAGRRGTNLGRKPLQIPPEFEKTYREYVAGAVSARDAAASLGVSHTTFLRWCHAQMDDPQSGPGAPVSM